jgi:hypothetical protein
VSDEADIERLLRRVRPAGPGDSLRTRILADVGDARAWPWVAAAAVLFGISFGLHGATDRLESAVTDGADVPPIDARVEHATQALGGGPDSRVLATFVVTSEELERRARAMEVQP